MVYPIVLCYRKQEQSVLTEIKLPLM